ncbi:MAG: hypothetical protein JWM16_5659 [Verrucomicrobiales bacterium]|nr:hypothetical protein [Verrucomicrobiales bacterium]
MNSPPIAEGQIPVPSHMTNPLQCIETSGVVPVGTSAADKGLSASEKDHLNQCEEEIRLFRAGFIKAGAALDQIQRDRLYRESFGSFESYCNQKWELSRAQAYRLIDAHRTMKNLSPIGDTPVPATESQLRPLTRLTTDLAQKAWAEAAQQAQGKPITAAMVKRVVESFQSPRKKKTKPDVSREVLQERIGQAMQLLDEVESFIQNPGEPAGLRDLLSQIRRSLQPDSE